MTTDSPGPGTDTGDAQGMEEDRVVARRVDNPTDAAPGDEATYRAADPAPDGDPAATTAAAGPHTGTGGSESERAQHEMTGADESEPTRSE